MTQGLEFVSKYSNGIHILEEGVLQTYITFEKVQVSFHKNNPFEIEKRQLIRKIYFVSYEKDKSKMEHILKLATHYDLNGRLGLVKFFTCVAINPQCVAIYFDTPNDATYNNNSSQMYSKPLELKKKYMAQMLNGLAQLCRYKKKCFLWKQNNYWNEKDVDFKFDTLYPSRWIYGESSIELIYFPFCISYETQTFFKTEFDAPEVIGFSTAQTQENAIFTFGVLVEKLISKEYFENKKDYEYVVSACKKPLDQRISIENLLELWTSRKLFECLQ